LSDPHRLEDNSFASASSIALARNAAEPSLADPPQRQRSRDFGREMSAFMLAYLLL
jgi:hypothetical protein